MMTFENPLSRSELARALGVDRARLWEWERSGLIPAGVRVRGNRTEFSPTAQMAAVAVLEARKMLLRPSRPGQVSQTAYMIKDAEGPKHLYILKLAGNDANFLGRPVGTQLIVRRLCNLETRGCAQPIRKRRNVIDKLPANPEQEASRNGG